jgi:trimeric autotransporter adhesin
MRTPALLATVLVMVGCGGGGGTAGNPPPLPAPQPGSLQFRNGSLAVDEHAAFATLTITRTNGTDGAVSVAVASSDGSASASSDYTAIVTTVSFAAGDASAKTVTVPIANDAAGEADETLALTLSAPSGGAQLGANTTATLTIRDDDPPSAPTVTVGATIKRLTFAWASVAGTTSYSLLRNPDGVSGFTRVGAELAPDVTNTTLDIAVHLHDWVNTSYRVEACNARGCTASAPISALSEMLKTIGYFKASNTDALDRFGKTVALSADGTTLAVGANGEDSRVATDENDNNAESAGAVYVFARVGSQWSQQAYLKAIDAQIEDGFGLAIALSADGNTLVVGEPGEASNAGATHIFTRVGSQWSRQASVTASNVEEEDFFGSSLALSADGNVLAVGASGEDGAATGVNSSDQANDGASSAGAVYVFTRAATDWSQQAYIKASTTGAFDRFGRSVALSADGNTLAVGADGEDSSGVGGDQANNDAESAGAAYVFVRSASSQWSQRAYLKASNADSADFFGHSVAVSADGGTLAVGAIGEGNGTGAAYVFARDSTQRWLEQALVKGSNTDDLDDLFGSALALSADGNMMVASAPLEDSGALGIGGDESDETATSAGAVYVFARSAGAWSQLAYGKAPNTDPRDLFGRSLALSADGSTLAVGADFEASKAKGIGGDQTSNDADEAGAAYIF